VLIARVRVPTYELDSFGHVNNAVYLHYLEEARSEFLKQIGLSFNDLDATGVHLVIVDAHVEYRSPARYGDEIVIAGSFQNVRPASVEIAYLLTEAASGRVVATATTKGAFVDARTGRPTRAPAAFREAFESSVASNAASHRL
jgi:acyl-CoA thioester hydrolase